MNGYITKRKTPGANPNNALQFKSLDGICCGDVTQALACRYEITFDVTSLTTVDVVRIGGISYTLDANYAMGYESGREGLLQNLRDLVEELGYSSKDAISGTIDGNSFTIKIDYSQLDFNWLDASAREFIPTDCKTIGKADANCCDARASVEIDGTDVIVTPVACQPITLVTINDGGGNVYSGALVNGTFSDATVLNGVITLDGSSATGQNWNGEVTLTITIATEGCANVVQTITLGLLPS
jgi:hypothetical protein